MTDYTMAYCRKQALDSLEAKCNAAFHMFTTHADEMTEENWKQLADARDWLDAIDRFHKRTA